MHGGQLSVRGPARAASHLATLAVLCSNSRMEPARASSLWLIRHIICLLVYLQNKVSFCISYLLNAMIVQPLNQLLPAVPQVLCLTWQSCCPASSSLGSCFVPMQARCVPALAAQTLAGTAIAGRAGVTATWSSQGLAAVSHWCPHCHLTVRHQGRACLHQQGNCCCSGGCQSLLPEESADDCLVQKWPISPTETNRGGCVLRLPSVLLLLVLLMGVASCVTSMMHPSSSSSIVRHEVGGSMCCSSRSGGNYTEGSGLHSHPSALWFSEYWV